MVNVEQLVDAIALSVFRANSAQVGPVVLGFCGFPYVGKTSVARALVDRLGGVLLPTEAFIASRDERLVSALDGCEPAAHDMTLMATSVNQLIRGQSVQLPEYSWIDGRAFGSRAYALERENDVLIIDGSVSYMVPGVDQSWFFQPTDLKAWSNGASFRDVQERSWLEDVADIENVRKFETVRKQRQDVLRSDSNVQQVYVTQTREVWSFSLDPV